MFYRVGCAQLVVSCVSIIFGAMEIIFSSSAQKAAYINATLSTGTWCGVIALIVSSITIYCASGNAYKRVSCIA